MAKVREVKVREVKIREAKRRMGERKVVKMKQKHTVDCVCLNCKSTRQLELEIRAKMKAKR